MALLHLSRTNYWVFARVVPAAPATPLPLDPKMPVPVPDPNAPDAFRLAIEASGSDPLISVPLVKDPHFLWFWSQLYCYKYKYKYLSPNSNVRELSSEYYVLNDQNISITNIAPTIYCLTAAEFSSPKIESKMDGVSALGSPLVFCR